MPTLRTVHGAQANGGVRIATTELPPGDELPAGLPDPAGAPDRAGHGTDGRFLPGNPDAAKGGRRRAGKVKLAHRLALVALPDGAAFAPYKASAIAFRRAQCAAIAASVGRGMCGPGPSSIVASAALALGWARYLSDKAAANDDPELAKMALKCGAESRACLRDAHALAVAEAEARPVRPVDVAALLASGEESIG